MGAFKLLSTVVLLSSSTSSKYYMRVIKPTAISPKRMNTYADQKTVFHGLKTFIITVFSIPSGLQDSARFLHLLQTWEMQLVNFWLAFEKSCSDWSPARVLGVVLPASSSSVLFCNTLNLEAAVNQLGRG
ncbi:hypothetical protein N656DRAFT_484531 [Canariomyces notabilis]|uniref:Secreted protein n=1 Tax=Canariomyces notabilis TaxID=2074819 RepID=A0AAN6TIM2_9PEZI|nr:hypothetical protein N656DRAFT_484531 [Canariomyces arenarius]